MRFYTTWRGKLALASAIVVVSLGVSGCFQTADATASPEGGDQSAPDAGVGVTATPTFFAEPTIEFAPSPVAVAQEPTTDPNLLPIDPNGFPTNDPNLAFGENQFNDPDATSTAIQATLFAQATSILQGVTETAAVEQTLTATALGTGAPFDPNAQPQIDPNTGQPITDPNLLQPQVATPTPVGTPGVAGSGAAGPIDPATCIYTVVQGDRIFRIALRFGLATETLARFNGIVNVDLISVDQKLRVPAPGCVLPTTPTPTPTITVTPSETPGPGTPTATPGAGTSPLSGTTYVVQAGDTLFAISIRTGVRISAIAQANNIDNINLIYIGQTLIIP
jgi:LysM repeat protein